MNLEMCNAAITLTCWEQR